MDDEESYKARIQQLEMLLAKHGVNDFADLNLSTEPIDMIVRTRSDSSSTYSSLMEKSTGESSTSASEEGGGRMEGFDRPSAGILEVCNGLTPVLHPTTLLITLVLPGIGIGHRDPNRSSITLTIPIIHL